MLAITHRVYETTLANSCVVLSRLFEKGISIHYVSNTSESQFCSDCNKRSSEVFPFLRYLLFFYMHQVGSVAPGYVVRLSSLFYI